MKQAPTRQHLAMTSRYPSKNLLQKPSQLLGPWLPYGYQSVAGLLNHYCTLPGPREKTARPWGRLLPDLFGTDYYNIRG